MATIADVAREAGVSRSTASYAFSGNRPISAEVRRRVLAAARRLEFTPNAGARSLATSQTRVIGLLAQFLEDEFAPAMLQYTLGVSNMARELGYDILLVTDADGTSALRRISDSRMVDGIVLLNVAVDDPRLDILRNARQPGALVGLPRDCSGVDVFDLDFEETGRAMIEHFHALGHRELVLVSPPQHVVDRGGAYVWRLQDAALEAADAHGIRLHTSFAPSTQPDVGRALGDLLDAHPRATGLLVNNEAAAAALPSVLGARSTRSPEDVSVLGRFSEEFARTFSLPYSFVESAPDRLGSMAVRQLVRRIEGATDTEEAYVVRLLGPEIVERGSTAPPRPTPAA
ncbi:MULTISPECIES: LacI family DNA-binding transcriptional regulator [unclassified Rathayibacter]|uniref:LacI family DNA-binding transcriptional regulator n=1 Tax=unclassified Rathayibacter TaxID=2609250 RepID=UPI000CE7EF3D|nr:MULTISPECIES: LacI family DNA-binding transcriptional regulator [unclassified Rathayibacter]PPF13112.1 LacI family transcriptional regulator [Rathayibacter sp. AY1A5]PPF26861.1 LacI family transcriptional regulator [Rathayibacter sp. AY1F2]PPH09637.1 LacI family transcriptional regulator [Rathayibacter sp. AY1H3]PPH09741.1 LacI family transcriptional regulator [Rathayibacter sp. AY1H3]PPH45163.1 LacI family transcriptional regulator [Rathayibacter sp. AY1F7]